MNEPPNIIRSYSIGNTKIKIADNYCTERSDRIIVIGVNTQPKRTQTVNKYEESEVKRNA